MANTMDRSMEIVPSPDDLIEKWIEPNPNRPGAFDVRLKEYCVPVWALVGFFRGMDGDISRVATAYDLPLEAVQAAVAYYERHTEIIDARIAANLA